jgi:hypothetical protein
MVFECGSKSTKSRTTGRSFAGDELQGNLAFLIIHRGKTLHPITYVIVYYWLLLSAFFVFQSSIQRVTDLVTTEGPHCSCGREFS